MGSFRGCKLGSYRVGVVGLLGTTAEGRVMQSSKGVKIILWAAGITSFLFFIAYIETFRTTVLPRNTEAWAHFGNYMAGTVGVILVLSSVLILAKTWKINRDMIEIQREELRLTRNELKSTAESNRKLVAYSAIQVFDNILDQTNYFIDKWSEEKVSIKGNTIKAKFLFMKGHYQFIEQMTSAERSALLLEPATPVIALCKIASNIIKEDDALYHYFYIKTKERRDIMKALIYYFSNLIGEKYNREMFENLKFDNPFSKEVSEFYERLGKADFDELEKVAKDLLEK